MDSPVVLITGATGALWQVVARRFAGEGARVALVGRDEDRLAEVGAELGVGDDRWLAITGELSDGGDARAVERSLTQKWGRTDILVHLVGGWAGGTTVVELDPAEINSMLEQHLWTTLHIVQAVVPGMVERGFGRVLAVSSPFATEPGPGRASFALAKAAEESLIRSLAHEVAGSAGTANLVIVRRSTSSTSARRRHQPTTRRGRRPRRSPRRSSSSPPPPRPQ